MEQKRILGLIAAVCVVGATSAAFGQVVNGGDRITWTPEAQELTLAIAGPNGFVYKETFAPGLAPEFPIFDAEGALLKDGVYTWEIVGNPDIELPDVVSEVRGLEKSLSIASPRSGAFSIARGSLAPDLQEGQLQTKDIQHLDDVIISFSLCVGNDCVNGESFGFDTIRLKENNLRIHFQDTSTTASFPSNDWRIVINDSSNGGGNYWAIEDSSAGRQVFRVDAGAPANALRVDSGGDVGIGTATPVVDLHVVSGNTPTLRLEQNGSSGFTAQTWDLAGNEANLFIRDATNGSQLPFRIQPGADSDSIFIANDNDIGIGTSSPATDAAVHISRTDAAITLLQIENTNAAPQNTGVRIDNGSASGAWDFRENTVGQFTVNLVGTGALLTIDDDTQNVTVASDLIVNGMCTGCDAVFQPGFQLESIEEHAVQMWQNSYLPAVGPTPEGKTALNVFEKTTGILQELEKAHIYIEQLNSELRDRDASLLELQDRLERLEQLVDSRAAE